MNSALPVYDWRVFRAIANRVQLNVGNEWFANEGVENSNGSGERKSTIKREKTGATRRAFHCDNLHPCDIDFPALGKLPPPILLFPNTRQTSHRTQYAKYDVPVTPVDKSPLLRPGHLENHLVFLPSFEQEPPLSRTNLEMNVNTARREIRYDRVNDRGTSARIERRKASARVATPLWRTPASPRLDPAVPGLAPSPPPRRPTPPSAHARTNRSPSHLRYQHGWRGSRTCGCREPASLMPRVNSIRANKKKKGGRGRGE